jgi:hypothetical protein
MTTDGSGFPRIFLVVAVLAMAGKTFGAQLGWFERFFLKEAYTETKAYWMQVRIDEEDKPTQRIGNMPVVRCDNMYPFTYLR